MALNDTQIKNIKKQPAAKKFSDGGGLHLLVTPSGSKLWRMAYRYDGKQKLLAFGKYPDVSLADARAKRDEARGVLAKGIDPSRKQKDDRLQAEADKVKTFGLIADEWLAKIEKEGRAEATMSKVRWLVDLARADLGDRPIKEITAAEILVPLRKVEAKGNYESAVRLRSTIGQVYRYAIATSRAENDPTFGLRGALTTPRITHRAAVTTRTELSGLLRSIWGYEGQFETRACLQLMACLYPRPAELRLAEWSEFDLDKGVWTIPASRTKMRRQHTKPLPKQAISILRELHKHNGDGKLVFPSVRSRVRAISENTMNAALRRLGYATDEATAHGFRATASTLLNENGQFSPDAIEAELAHVGADLVRRAYHRAQYWDERVKMAAWWADELDELRMPTHDIFS
ncbi:integrase arm-type DNA-binding domain-containing protein [Phyllobacterium sp. UNC302MFCol5.2]|uniref:tyrosine-type recombinase/integrase n=1 Tax=Phyllobacterium sp. UNC302MFCol5.2 TaxID=1449065 RepID=UPI0004804B72|nr:integrase arm-type DNA-binding domain-containing protein [Phyllobacterium sp. UNC302MFCol5.2]